MKLLLFDIDGTLILSRGVGRTALALAIEEVAEIVDPLRDVSLGGRTDPGILDEVFKIARRPLDGQSAAIFERYLELLAEGLQRATGFRTLAGVRDLLDRLSPDPEVALALGTGNIEGGARLKLGHAELNDYFPTGGFGSDALSRADLLRAGVRKAERHFETAFETVWVIGDTPRDVEAAREAGLRSAAVATGGYAVAALAECEPDLIFEDLGDGEAVWRALTDSAD